MTRPILIASDGGCVHNVMTYKNVGIHSRLYTEFAVNLYITERLHVLENILIALTIIKWRVLGRHQPEASDLCDMIRHHTRLVTNIAMRLKVNTLKQ